MIGAERRLHPSRGHSRRLFATCSAPPPVRSVQPGAAACVSRARRPLLSLFNRSTERSYAVAGRLMLEELLPHRFPIRVHVVGDVIHMKGRDIGLRADTNQRLLYTPMRRPCSLQISWMRRAPIVSGGCWRKTTLWSGCGRPVWAVVQTMRERIDQISCELVQFEQQGFFATVRCRRLRLTPCCNDFQQQRLGAARRQGRCVQGR